MMPLRRTLMLLFVVILLGASWLPVSAQSLDGKYFSETGHNVVGEFYKFYSSNANATFLYGYPITDEFVSKDGKKVQYFQRARFEYRADLPEGQRVQITPLGGLTYVSTGKLEVNNNSFACRAYPETGFSVCFAFLEFINQYGGVAQFGYPISGFEYHENKLVQYFEKARLEWQPWKPEGQRVVVSDLGRLYFDKLGEDPGLLSPVPPYGETIQKQTVLKLQVRAFAWKAVTLANDTQVVFIVVQDQNLQPVSNANCTAIMHWPNGQNTSQALSTNVSGVSIMPLSFTDQPYGGLVYADVSCAYNSLNGNTTTSFRIWY